MCEKVCILDYCVKIRGGGGDTDNLKKSCVQCGYLCEVVSPLTLSYNFERAYLYCNTAHTHMYTISHSQGQEREHSIPLVTHIGLAVHERDLPDSLWTSSLHTYSHTKQKTLTVGIAHASSSSRVFSDCVGRQNNCG